MHPSRKDLIVPIRARSALSAESKVLNETSAIRNVQTRRSLIHRKQDIVALSLVAFIKALREEVRGFPLTILLHGWLAPASQEFMESPGLIEKRDALWLISLSEDVQSTMPVGETVLLKPNWTIANNDSRLYDNLVADIAYFPAAEQIEADYLRRIQGRARTILIDNSGPENGALLELVDQRIRRYLRAGDNVFSDRQTPPHVSVPGKTDDNQVPPQILRMGRMLKEMSEYLGAEIDRRFEFRSYIEKVRRKSPEQSQFKIQLILMADKYDWPAWAVESIPSLCVPTSTAQDGSVIALVWRQVCERLPTKPQIESELCNGQFVEVKLSKEEAERAEMIARTIEDHLGRNPYPSDSAFLGTIDHALSVLEEERDGPEQSEI